MAKLFHFKICTDPEFLINRAEKMAAENGININGNLEKGHFFGNGIEGEYHLNAREITLTVFRKPIFLSWAYVESTIKEFFS